MAVDIAQERLATPDDPLRFLRLLQRFHGGVDEISRPPSQVEIAGYLLRQLIPRDTPRDRSVGVEAEIGNIWVRLIDCWIVQDDEWAHAGLQVDAHDQPDGFVGEFNDRPRRVDAQDLYERDDNLFGKCRFAGEIQFRERLCRRQVLAHIRRIDEAFIFIDGHENSGEQ